MDYKGRVDVDHVLNGKYVEQFVGRITDVAAAKARAMAPVESGALKASIRGYTEKFSGAKRDRVVGVVSAGTDHAVASEFGTSSHRGHYFLRGALPR